MMTHKKEMKSLILIALPLMAAFLAQRGMQFIDTMMMGWLGPTALAAGALGTAFFVTISLFCMGALSAVGVFIARAKGENKIDDIPSTLQHGFCLVFLLAFPCMILIWFVPSILLKLGEDPLVVNNTALLLHGLVWGFPGILLFFVLREFNAAFSLTWIVMLVALCSLPLTFAVNYILIYGKYHLPALGIAGIGYGGALIMWVMFFLMLIYSLKHTVLKQHLILKPFIFDPNKLLDLLQIGLPSGVLFLLDAGMFLSTTVMMGFFGIFALAAHQIALQCVNIAYTLPIALSMATAYQVGHASGAQNNADVQRIAKISFSIVLLISMFLALIFILGSNSIVNIFLSVGEKNFNEVHQFATTFLKIAALFLCFDALQAVANGALRGLRDTVVPMLYSLGCYWFLGVCGAYFLSMHTTLGASGIWYGLTLGLSSAAILLVLRFFYRRNVLSSTK